MTLSFRARLTLRLLLAFGVVLTLAMAAVYAGTRSFLYRDLDAQLRTLAATELASAVDEPGDGVHLHEFSIPGTQEFADKFVQLVREDGTVLMQSPLLGTVPAILPRAVLAQALAGASPTMDVSLLGRRGRMIGLVTAGPERYVVAVGLFADQLESTLRTLAWLLAGVWAVSLAATAVAGFTIASSVLAPVRRITERAAAIADGQFDARLDDPGSDDEIGRMTALLNRMLDRLRGAIDANRRFAADASHELRGPLTAILGEVDVTLKRERDGTEYRRVLAEVGQRIRQMGDLTEDLMLLVRAQERRTPPMAEVSLAVVMRESIESVAGLAAERSITISSELTPSLVAYADAGLLRRVFDNLLRNAVQYNRDGGAVRVSGRLESQPGEWASDAAVIHVEDTGPGIPEAERERVFERFRRLDASRSRRTGGTGLGLAIAREIVELFGGRVQVLPGVQTGTVFEVRLPGGRAADVTSAV